MHLLRAKPGGFQDEEGITDLRQTPGDIVVLSAQDTDLNLLAKIQEQRLTRSEAPLPELRLANLMLLKQPASFDLYFDQVLQQARLIVVSLLGGRAYWQYIVEGLTQSRADGHQRVIFLPGDDQADEELFALSDHGTEQIQPLWRQLREGGPDNAQRFLCSLERLLIDPQYLPDSAKPLPRTLLYHPDLESATLEDWHQDWTANNPDHQASVAAVLFYRAHWQSMNTQALDEFIGQIRQAGLNPLPIAVASLKDASCQQTINHLCDQAQVSVILNTTGFAVSTGDISEGTSDPVDQRYFSRDVPVLQVILAGNSQQDWQANSLGLRPPDLAMNIALPELDGRIISRAISFKDSLGRNEATQNDLVGYRLDTNRGAFVAELAARWARLHRLENADKRVAIILANYPTRDGRLGNGVGLDTPASTVNLLRAMARQGYASEALPEDGDQLIQALLQEATNNLDQQDLKGCAQSLDLQSYQAYFDQLPQQNQDAIIQRWGPADQDPRLRKTGGREAFLIPGLRLHHGPEHHRRDGITFIGIQPARGYQIDLSASYHDPDLIPPHYYLAYYLWIRETFKADALIHMGKHGNLEWLPGKGNALSPNCWPEVALGPLPHFYPFIVNDPGEGSQAKRRAQAVIIDHLMPPMTRAETYGDLQKLEGLVDEFYQAQDLDPARAEHLRKQILEQSRDLHLDEELSAPTEDSDALLQGLDAYLCELKEAQIRGGLHIFGESPAGESRIDTIVALLRLPRSQAHNPASPADQSGLLHALIQDLGMTDMDFDPLTSPPEQPWSGPRPPALMAVSEAPWRSNGDTRERLELLSKQILNEDYSSELFQNTLELIAHAKQSVIANLDRSGAAETGNLLHGLKGGFVPPGPSGAPTRGRLDVLPTGRNFYSLDTRAIPTPAAWHLGWKSAQSLIDRHLQDQGDYPRSLGLSVWGTSTMRTGGDDIAQAMALIGVRPVWAVGSNRVTDFEILPADLLDRPRVDVTLRISGFFRDAFISTVQLFDAAVQAVIDQDEPESMNPLRARALSEMQSLAESGLTESQARQQAGWRVFGSKPGAYGAGLQGLIDERHWESGEDLALAYLNWGSYAYGQTDKGTVARDAFAQRLANVEVVLQNQDNREHDILDSDDYYQFQGGMSNAVRTLSKQSPAIYHGDHSHPENPRIRTLSEELSRVIRSRVTNPKWLEAIQRHGYKGAFEMAATVDYLFAYDATTGLVRDDQYQSVTDSYLLDDKTRAFLEQHNPHALKEMAERLTESIQRGLWNASEESRQALEDIILDAEDQVERTPSGTASESERT